MNTHRHTFWQIWRLITFAFGGIFLALALVMALGTVATPIPEDAQMMPPWLFLVLFVGGPIACGTVFTVMHVADRRLRRCWMAPGPPPRGPVSGPGSGFPGES